MFGPGKTDVYAINYAAAVRSGSHNAAADQIARQAVIDFATFNAEVDAADAAERAARRAEFEKGE